jgi:hypothetical protein
MSGKHGRRGLSANAISSELDAASAQISAFTLTQTAGAACTPVVASLSLPVALGNNAPGNSAGASFTMAFSGCQAATATLRLATADGALVGAPAGRSAGDPPSRTPPATSW